MSATSTVQKCSEKESEKVGRERFEFSPSNSRVPFFNRQKILILLNNNLTLVGLASVWVLDMKIPEKEYSIETFTEALMGIVLPSHQRLKVACFMTAFSQWHDPTKMVNLENILTKWYHQMEERTWVFE